MRIVMATLALMVAAPAAMAQQYCAERHVVVDRLKTGYGESYAGGGLRNETSVFEVWFSEEDGTWTILMTLANGQSCVMASGTNWREGPLDEAVAGVPG